MRYIVLALLGFLGLVLQSTLFNELRIAGVKPDLILILVILFAVFNGSRSGAGAGLLLGLIEDIFLAKYIGLNALTKGLVGLLVGLLEKRTYKDNFIVPILALFFGSIAYGFFFFLGAKIVGYPLGVGHFAKIIIPMAIYNTCFAPFVYGSFYKSATKGFLKM